MSYVAMASHVCPVCGETHRDAGELLIDKRLRNDAFPDNEPTVVGYELCAVHQEKFDEGYLALVEVTNPNSTKLKLHEADRTGRVMHITREAFLEMMDTELPDDLPMVYADPKLLEAIESLYISKAGHSNEI